MKIIKQHDLHISKIIKFSHILLLNAHDRNNGISDELVCIVITKFGLYCGEVLPNVEVLNTLVGHYTVAVKKDSSDYVPLEFESSFGSDPAHFIVKYSSINIA